MKQLFISCFLLALFACKDKTKSQEKQDTPEEQVNIIPVSSFFNEQIHEVDSLKLPTVKYFSEGKIRDTSSISLEEFKLLANEFLAADISKPSVSSHYRETNFADQSIPSVTFTYSTDNISLPVKRMDVLLDPSPVADDKVKTVFIEIQQVINDTAINKKLYWKSHKNFQIITSKQLKNKPEVITLVKVAWDNSDGF